MIKPDSISGRLIGQMHRRGGKATVDRRCFPPSRVFNQLLKKGYVERTREGLPRSRTTRMSLTQAGRAIATKLFGPAEYQG